MAYIYHPPYDDGDEMTEETRDLNAAPAPADVPPVEEGSTAAEPIPEAGTFESPTSNDVGEQTLTNADKAESEDDEETETI